MTPERLSQQIDRLKLRMAEVRGLASVRHDDPKVEIITEAIRFTILQTFGPNSGEWTSYKRLSIWDGDEPPQTTTPLQHQIGFEAGIPKTIRILEGLVARLERRIRGGDYEQAIDPVPRLEGLKLHPRIAAIAAALYKGGHYRNAVLDAYLAVETFVKEKSQCRDISGVDLMRRVFSRKTPILAFNDGLNESQLNEQEGLMHLFEGVALALRNPRAHSLVSDTADEALEYLNLLSLLANRVEKAKKVRDT